MGKVRVATRRALKYFLIGCLTITVLLGVVVGTCIWMSRPSTTIELSEYGPFRSAEAKEKYLKLYDLRAKKWPVASETKMVETPYGPTLVRISGPQGAPPLVLLPGAGANSLHWGANVQALSYGYRTYAVDSIYDFGRSVYTRPLRSSEDLVKWLDELFDALGLGDRINLMGLSYGGWLTTQYALRFPNRLRKIVLLAPAATVLQLRLEFMARAIPISLPIPYFTKSLMYWVLEDMVKKDEASRLLVDVVADDMFTAMRCFKPRHLVNPTVLTDKELQDIKMPTLFLVGENEKIYSAQKAVQRLREVAPRIKTETIPHAGHDLAFVQAEMVNGKVLEFLREP